MEYSIRDGALTTEFAGVFEAQDVVSRFLAALADPACPTPVALLIDISCSDSLATRPAAEIRMIAEFLGPYAERIGGRAAVVAPSDVHFGLARWARPTARGRGSR